MRIEIVGKNGFVPSEANKEYATKKLSKLENYLDDYENLSARVVCKVYKSYHKIEVTIPTKNIILRAEVMEEDLYAAIDGAIDKLVKQVRRYNDKVKDKLGKPGIRQATEVVVKPQTIVRDKHVDLAPMTKEEALDQMELLGHDFFVFINAETEDVNVVYKRKGNTYGLIEPEY